MRARILGGLLGAVLTPIAANAEPLQVFVHFPESSAETLDVAKRVGLQMIDDGFDVVDLRPVPIEMRATTIRYFRPELRDDALRLKAYLERLLRDSGIATEPIRVQDFTFFEPKPRPNSVELWFKPEQPRQIEARRG
jgi:hypothetical protein